MSLRVLSRKSGVSANALSLIERSKTSPTVTTLLAVARAFNLRVNDLFSEDNEERADYVLYKCSGSGVDCAIEALASNLKSQNLNPVLLRLGPNERFRKDLCSHPGDEFVYCLTGKIECELGGDKVILDEGDAITYKGELPHRIWNMASTGSTALVVYEIGRL